MNDFTIETINTTTIDVSLPVDSDDTRCETSTSSDDSDNTNDPTTTSTSYIEHLIFTQPNQNQFSMITKTDIIRILHLGDSRCRNTKHVTKRKKETFSKKVCK